MDVIKHGLIGESRGYFIRHSVPFLLQSVGLQHLKGTQIFCFNIQKSDCFLQTVAVTVISLNIRSGDICLVSMDHSTVVRGHMRCFSLKLVSGCLFSVVEALGDPLGGKEELLNTGGTSSLQYLSPQLCFSACSQSLMIPVVDCASFLFFL